jgi:energy-coupling factor transport system ATP-binding protein
MTAPVAELADVTFRYPSAETPAIAGETWQLEEGTFALVMGPSGTGKSSVLRCLNGLVPHFSGGQFGGSVQVAGLDTRSHGPRELSRSVAFVFQDPEAQLVTDRVDDEIAFGIEQHGVDRSTMRLRVEEALDYVGIEHLRNRRPSELSGGERQRVAIASALAMHPTLLVLDEPTSQLDPWAAEDVFAVLDRLNHDLGITVVVAEHRLERVLPRADVVRAFGPEGRSVSGAPAEIASLVDPVALPPVTRLGRSVSTSPAPLTVREAKRAFRSVTLGSAPATSNEPAAGNVVTEARDVSVRLGGRTVLERLDLAVREGELVAVLGRNGSGKTTLLRSLAGLQRLRSGSVVTCGVDLVRNGPEDLERRVGYLPQQASTLFYEERLRDALGFSGTGTSDVLDAALRRFHLEGKGDRHPMDLSGGERERAALAAVMSRNPRLLLLDEPTRGMDAWCKQDLANHLVGLRRHGVAIVMVTHDVELAAHCASRVVLLGDGDIVADGDPRQVLAGGLSYTTQINKVFGETWLTVEDVQAAWPESR